MKANFYIENQRFCLAYDRYVIEEINGKRYVLPEKGAKNHASTFSDWIDRYLIDILNIGKKVYYNEEVEDIEILDYVRNYGLFGFMADFPINRYYVLDDNVALRDYNLIDYEDHITNMKFIGFKKKDELAKYFAASDIFVLPTRYDIWGLVINEAMSFGLPIISTDKCAAADELINIFDNGIIVPIEDEKQLAKAIDTLANDKNLRLRYGRNSLNGIKDYTIENMIKDYLVIFDKVKKDESTADK